MGAAKLSGDTLNYAGVEGFRIAGKQGVAVIAACQLVLMGGPEYARYVGIKGLEPVGIFLPGDQNYPGAMIRLICLICLIRSARFMRSPRALRACERAAW